MKLSSIFMTGTKLKIQKYKKGDKTAGIYCGFPMTAGEDMSIVSAYGIYADVFDKGKYYQIPNVQSKKPGSGRFSQFLEVLKTLDKPVYFCSVVNQHLYKYLSEAKIGVVVDGNFYQVQIQDKVKTT